MCVWKKKKKRTEESRVKGAEAKEQEEEADKRDSSLPGKQGSLYTSRREGGESESGQCEKLDAAGRRRRRPCE